MRSAGVQIEALIEYVALLQANTGLKRRKEILIEQRARLQKQAETLRTTGNLRAYHLPWYYDYDNLPEDERYYMEQDDKNSVMS